MSLKETLATDLKTAMKDKDKIRKDTVQMVRAAILQVEKDQKITLDDSGIIEIVARQLKQRKDSLLEFEKAGRQDLIDNTNREIETLTQYLPEQLSDESLGQIIQESIVEVGASSIKEMGKVMKVVLPKVKGKADGSKVNALVKKYLDT